MLPPDQRASLGAALKEKLERRFHRLSAERGGAAGDPQGTMAGVVRALASELEGEEARRRQAGDTATANAFQAVRNELLSEIAGLVLAENRTA